MPGDQAKTTKPSMPKRILSIRARLMFLALLAMAPLMFERVHALEAARAERTERANAEVIDLARRGADAQQEIIYSVRALLQIVARIYDRIPSERSDCGHYLTNLASNIPWISGLSIAGTDGRIRCSTTQRAIGLDVSRRAHFSMAMRLHDFALSDYVIGQIHQAPSLMAGFPVLAEDGSVSAVVLGVINMQWLSKLIATATQRSGASVLLIDGSGTLIAASASEENLVGKRFADRTFVQDILAHDEGTMTTAGLDGVRRIFAYVHVPWTQARLAVGLGENAVHDGIDREIGIAYLQLVLIGIFVLIVTWLGGERLIVQPIRALVHMVARFGHGDLHVRAAEETWVAEFKPLAAAFDDMANKLATREEELRIANEHLEELASLDGLTGLANRRGFDRELEGAWKRAAESGQPLALMMIDIDHFKLYNDRYGHVSGDTCLRAVGETLSLVTLEEAVLVARYGGEEYALLLPGLDLTRAAELAEEARKSIEDLLITHAEAPCCGVVTISIGVESLVPEKGQSAADLVEAADNALYAAKRGGRNKVVARVPVLLSMAS
ncbi:MAG: diguanylate cyclase [Xanthobacteraceae bacterium]